MILQAALPGVQVDVPTEPITSGAVFVLLDAVARNWPICAAAVAFIWYMGKFVKSVESIAASVRSNKEETEKKLTEHGEKLDDHDRRISRTEQSTAILLNHTGLTAP